MLLLLPSLGYLALAVFAGGTRVCASFLGVACGWRIADNLRMRLLRHAAPPGRGAPSDGAPARRLG